MTGPSQQTPASSDLVDLVKGSRVLSRVGPRAARLRPFVSMAWKRSLASRWLGRARAVFRWSPGRWVAVTLWAMLGTRLLLSWALERPQTLAVGLFHMWGALIGACCWTIGDRWDQWKGESWWLKTLRSFSRL